MVIGYARVLTTDQNLNLQKDARGAAGCERLFTDNVSGAKVERSGWSMSGWRYLDGVETRSAWAVVDARGRDNSVVRGLRVAMERKVRLNDDV